MTNKSAAVRAQRAPNEVASDDATRALYRRLNFFPTPPWATRAVFECIERVDAKPFAAMTAYDPCCGQGHMAATLAERFRRVQASDIHDHGFGNVQDFLAPPIGEHGTLCDWAIFNPPFNRAEAFLRQAFRIARRGVALLGRVQLLETPGRYGLMTEGDGERFDGLTLYAPFCERVSMHLGQWLPSASPMPTAYAWFLFRRVDYQDGSFALPPYIIPPGTKLRLTKPDDARRWGAKGDAPLFEGGDDA